MSRGDRTQGSEMSQEDLRNGNAGTSTQQVVGNGGPHLSGQWQHPFAPVFGFPQPDLGRAPEDIRKLQATYFLVPQAEHRDEKQHCFVAQPCRLAGIDAFDQLAHLFPGQMPWDLTQTPFPQLGYDAIQIDSNASTPAQVSQECASVTAQIVAPGTTRVASCKLRDEFQNIDTVEAIDELVAVPILKPDEKSMCVAQRFHAACQSQTTHIA